MTVWYSGDQKEFPYLLQKFDFFIFLLNFKYANTCTPIPQTLIVVLATWNNKSTFVYFKDHFDWIQMSQQTNSTINIQTVKFYPISEEHYIALSLFISKKYLIYFVPMFQYYFCFYYKL